MWAIVKGLVVWLLAALPVGVLLGLLVSTFVPENAVVDRSTAAFNGAMAGLQLAVVGGIAAAITTTVSRDMLKRVGGSECISGAAIAYGVIILGLCALLLV